MTDGGDLSNDLVFRILARLPVKSLLRFAVVCRRWRHVIMYDLNFARAQLQAARDYPSQCHRRLLVSARKPRIQSFHLEKETETASFEVRKVNNFPHREQQVTLLGSCNGIVFVTPISYGEWVCVWNPSIYNSCKQLPNPKFDLVVDGYDGAYVDWNAFFGVGHVAATDDYKVLVAHSEYYESDDEDDDDDSTVMEVKMFSMRSNCWKTIKPLKGSVRSDKTPATVVKERLHWISTGFCEFAHEIVVFDLEKEELETMPLPDIYANLFKVSRLGVSAGGCLCMVRFPILASIEQDYACDSFMDFWVMTEYGVAGSWEKLYRFSYRSWGRCDEMLVTEKCTVVAMRKTIWDKERTKLIRIEHKDKKEPQFGRRYTTLRKAVDSMLEYEESLIRYDYDDLTLDGI